MPVHPVSGGYRFGESGKTYRSKAAAARQAAAIYASGWREDARIRRAAHKALSPSKRAEGRYVLDLLGIIGRVHATVLQALAPADERRDAWTSGRLDATDDRLVRRLFRVVRTPVQTAFDFMAGAVDKSVAQGMRLVGIQPRFVPGLGAVLATAREKNVRLIQSASEDFVRQVRDTLEENEGLRPEEIAKLLTDRTGVSKSRATLIARDQTTKLASNLNQHRQRAAGVTQYRWSGSLDSRERESHRELEGQVFDWDDPPMVDDEPANPGEPVQCRCIALPVIAEFEEEAGEEAQEPEEEEYGVAAEE